MSNPALDPEIITIERGLIGGCLADTRGCRVWPTLRAEEFLLDRHRLIWQAMLDLTEVTEHPELLDLSMELRRRGHLDLVGGVGNLAEIMEAGIIVFDLAHWGRKIREAATGRARAAFAGQLLRQPDMPQGEIEQALRNLEMAEAAPALSVAESFVTEQGRIQQEPPVRTGLPEFDAKLGGGVAPGQLLVIGGRTSHGKTAFATWIARSLADRGTGVDYLSLEERAEAIHARWISQITGVPLFRIRQGQLDTNERESAEGAAVELDALPLRVLTLRATREANVVAAVAASKAQVVVVDHLQQIITEGRSRVYELERVLTRLSGIATADRKLILVTAQLSRAADARREAPTLADLRDSGAIEQIARQVWLLYWPVRHNADKAPTDYECEIAKNSEGPTGRVDLGYDARSGRFWCGGSLA